MFWDGQLKATVETAKHCKESDCETCIAATACVVVMALSRLINMKQKRCNFCSDRSMQCPDCAREEGGY